MEMNYNEETLRVVEQELHIELIPGTEIMADIGTHHFVKSTGHSGKVLVPQPSSDPHDPLNWSALWKVAVITTSLMSTFSMGFGPMAIGPIIPYLMQDFNSSLEQVVQFISVCILVLGFSNLLWVPISSIYGRRVVLLASTLVCLGSHIWRATATSYWSFMGACILNGVGAGPAETIAPTVIADIHFLHDRGKYNTTYFASYFAAYMVGPIVAGPMASHIGQRAFWWLNVGITSLCFLVILITFPETKWQRVHPAEIPDGVSAASNVLVEDNDSNSASKDEYTNAQSTNKETQEIEHIETVAKDPFLGKGRPSKQQFKLFQNADHRTTWLVELWTPWRLLALPIVVFAGFVVSWSASVFLAVNLTQSQVFAAPPYNYSSDTIGYFNFAILIGTFLGLLTAGPQSDWISAILTVRNNNVREPEMRLLTMIPYVIIMIIGNIVTAVGYDRQWSWKVIVIIGYTCSGIQVAALPAIVSTYAVDSYKPAAGSIFVAITVIKNLWAYGFGKCITPWTMQVGYTTPILTNMALTTAFCLFGILFWYQGKRFRRWSRNSKVLTLSG